MASLANIVNRGLLAALGAGLLVTAASAPAWAGRGSSPYAVQTAIASGSADAIAAELERAEHLVCTSCETMIRPLLDSENDRVRHVAAWWLARRAVRQDVIAEMVSRLDGGDSVKARNAA